MTDFETIRNILVKFKNRDITQDAAEDQLLDLVRSKTISDYTNVVKPVVDYKKIDIDYDELSKAILKNDPEYSPQLKKLNYETVNFLEEIPLEENWEKTIIIRALEQNKGNRKKAATLLKISERTLYRKIKVYEIEENFKDDYHVSRTN